jgi:Domain of unknown function (DUF4385)
VLAGGVACGDGVYTGRMGYSYSGVDLRKHPEAYRVGRGEQGVFHAEPYKSELLPLWKFKDAGAARESADAIYRRFLGYKDEGDFVGMDVARKYLQMGYTRSRRYAEYEGGNKSKPLDEPDPVKSRVAEIFYEKWREAAEDEGYLELKEEHRRRNG